MTVNIGSSSEWNRILTSSTIVVADFYADWCGPCKTIAPHFESLSTKYSKPKRLTFCKINVDNQRDIAAQYSVSAMPTFLILKNGAVIETIKGANPPALTAAVDRAAKSATNAAPGAGFMSKGRTLGGASGSGGGAAGSARAALRRPLFTGTWRDLMNAVITFFGLYFVSLFSLDPYKAAEASQFNIHNKSGQTGTARTGASGAGQGARNPQRSRFQTLADLGKDTSHGT